MMCRFVAYLGRAIPLARVVSEPEHSLVIQSYRPVEMTSGVVNADGFGVGWYNRTLDPTPCVYTNITPIWSDRNLPGLSKHIASGCIFANVRSATPGQTVDQSNCQPFGHQQFLFMHNGYVENFRGTLMRRIRQALHDEYYGAIGGTTDSEHIFALFLNSLHGQPATAQTMSKALNVTIRQLHTWAESLRLHVALNVAVTNGECLVVSRFSTSAPAPSLYYHQNSALFPDATVVASERLSPQMQWSAVPENSIMAFTDDLHTQSAPVFTS
jgi:ergothioneine biosynthesis protein EgtC